jgi:hypothetical protein
MFIAERVFLWGQKNNFLILCHGIFTYYTFVFSKNPHYEAIFLMRLFKVNTVFYTLID